MNEVVYPLHEIHFLSTVILRFMYFLSNTDPHYRRYGMHRDCNALLSELHLTGYDGLRSRNLF